MTDATELEIIRGEQAARLLADPMLAEAFEAVEQELMGLWKDSPARDLEGRESLWLQLKMLHRVRIQLEKTLDSGKVARETLAQRLGRRLKDAF